MMLSRYHKETNKTEQKEERQFIVFLIGKEHFGVDVRQAREIISTKELTFIPNAPDFVRGVINLRGVIIPIIDLKKRLHIEEDYVSKEPKIIIVEVNDTLIGVQVDDVKEMIRLYDDDIAEAPEITKGINKDYLSGVGKLENKLLILLSLNKILSAEEVKNIDDIMND